MAMRGISGDAHFFEESMNWDRIRKLLDNKLGVAGHAEKLEAMKALLASISKGEDVSMFFADVVKNVIVASVEVKKLVYMYLVHYADANSQCRELALLSINSFQKDLADPNQLIRALALRVMTSIRVRDILQIQLIAIRKCTADASAYVRKCAANAISKIYVVDPEQQDVLADIIGKLLSDSSTMVLGSAVQALVEVCPDRLDLLHRPFRTICHLLADLDEWGQTVTINVLMRYCHEQFNSPQVVMEPTDRRSKELFPKRKVQRGFYSDDDDDDDDAEANTNSRRISRESSAQSPFLLGGSSGAGPNNKRGSAALPSIGSVFRSDALASGIGGGEELDEDHRLLLRSSIPLLKSRNSAVVLAVATLHYYCGTQSVATSTLIGKSLVRIMRSQREIQFVVLSVIAAMATARADMFRPFLPDFFVRATDAAYARKLKLEILTALATSETVGVILRECQAYVRHVDKAFVTLTIRALGRVADAMPSVAERVLSGLMRLVRSTNEQVVAESVVVIRQLLQQRAVGTDQSRVVRSLAAMLVSGRVTSASARASIVWMLGEFQDNTETDSDESERNGSLTTTATETLRLLVRTFCDEPTEVRLQLLNLAVKLALRNPQRRAIQLLLQYVLELCKFDGEYDVRDRARLVRAALSGDSTNVVSPFAVFATPRPAPLIGGGEQETARRFTLGSLSDIVRHSVPGYAPLPHWRTDKPDRTLRDAAVAPMVFSDDDRSSDRRHRHGGSSSNAKATKSDKRGKDAAGFYSEDESASGSDSESESGSGSGSDSDVSSDVSDSASDSDTGSASGNDSDVSSSESVESDASASESESESVSSGAERRQRRRTQRSKSTKKLQSPPPKSKTKAKTSAQPLDLLDPMAFMDSGSPGPTTTNTQLPMTTAFGPTTNNSLLGDLMSLSMAAPSNVPATKRTLLSAAAGNGLAIEYAFVRTPSMYSPTMNVVQLWLANLSDAPIAQLHVVWDSTPPASTTPSQTVIAFSAIPVLFPGGAASMAQLHVDFAGRLDAVALHVKTGDAATEPIAVALSPVAGELLLPVQLSADAFAQLIAQRDGTHLHTFDVVVAAPVALSQLVQAVVADTNVALVYEPVSGPHHVATCKFAGRVRTHDSSSETVLIALESDVASGRTRLLVAATDDVLAQQLAANIKRNLLGRDV